MCDSPEMEAKEQTYIHTDIHTYYILVLFHLYTQLAVGV